MGATCTFDSVPQFSVAMTIVAKEIIPSDWWTFWNCDSGAQHCRGLPACAKDGEFYQQTVTQSITVSIKDINNNPPRFFSQESKLQISSDAMNVLDCQSCTDSNVGDTEETSDSSTAEKTSLRLLVKNNEKTDPIVVHDMDGSKNN